jgi:hypothetical protein
MSRSFPVKDLPNGKSIYQDPGGTFSHQHPTSGWWCEKHRTIDEAWDCYQQQAQKEKEAPPEG